MRSALRLLTDDADSETTLETSLATLTRVLDAVHWSAISRGDPDAWLYFYEDFLSVYDNDLRKRTGYRGRAATRAAGRDLSAAAPRVFVRLIHVTAH